MNYNIVTAPTFLKELKHLSKKYRSLKKDLMNLQEELINNPETGTDLGRGIRKFEWLSVVKDVEKATEPV